MTEEVGELRGEERIADHAGVGAIGTVRLAADPTAEPVRVEPVGAVVQLDRAGEHGAAAVVGLEADMGAGRSEVGVREVPLAAVVGVVPGGAEPVADGGHGRRIEPVHTGVDGRLGQAVGVGEPVQRGELAGEHRGAARRARTRAGVVVVELDASGADAFAPRELRAPELGDGVVLVGRRVPLLVGHDDEDVGPRRHQALPVMRAGATNTAARRSSAITRSYSSQSSCDPPAALNTWRRSAGIADGGTPSISSSGPQMVVGPSTATHCHPLWNTTVARPVRRRWTSFARVAACDERDAELTGDGVVEDARVHE